MRDAYADEDIPISPRTYLLSILPWDAGFLGTTVYVYVR